MAPVEAAFDLYTYLSSLTLAQREAFSHSDSPLSKRDDNIPNVAPPNYAGAVDPANVNMKAIQATFAVIGAFMVLGCIWFFFWAKNGGFKWHKNDWEEYKSTVLRRKGPNGTTLSNASKSTRLGGGSVVGSGYSDRDAATYKDETSTVYTGTMSELSSSTAPIIKEKQGTYTGDKRERRKHSRRQETAKERKQREIKEAEFEGAHDADVRAYMRETAAQVGGINTTGDTLRYGTDYTDTESSVGYTNIEGYRPAGWDHSASVYSQQGVSSAEGTKGDRKAAIHHPRYPKQPRNHTTTVQAPAYYPPAGEASTKKSSPYTIRSVQHPPSTSSNGTKSYHHPLPELRGQTTGGFRRGGSSLDED